jgi:hypothetical protein
MTVLLDFARMRHFDSVGGKWIWLLFKAEAATQFCSLLEKRMTRKKQCHADRNQTRRTKEGMCEEIIPGGPFETRTSSELPTKLRKEFAGARNSTAAATGSTEKPVLPTIATLASPSRQATVRPPRKKDAAL